MVGDEDDNLLSFWRLSFFSAICTADLYSLVPQHQAHFACGSCTQRINSSIEKLLNACHIHRRHKSSDQSKSLPFQEQASPSASFFNACLLARDNLGYFLQQFPDWGISNKSWSRVWDCLFFYTPQCGRYWWWQQQQQQLEEAWNSGWQEVYQQWRRGLWVLLGHWAWRWGGNPSFFEMYEPWDFFWHWSWVQLWQWWQCHGWSCWWIHGFLHTMRHNSHHCSSCSCRHCHHQTLSRTHLFSHILGWQQATILQRTIYHQLNSSLFLHL